MVDGALSWPDELATTTMLMFALYGTVIVAVNELTELVTPDTTELSDAFRTCTAVTPDATAYVMLAVFPEYVMTLVNLGENAPRLSELGVTDAVLSRPFELPSAITTKLNEVANVIAMVAVVPLTALVVTLASLGNALRSDFTTLNAVTPESTVYVMDAVLPEYAMPPNNTGAVNCLINVCVADATLSLPVELDWATTTKTSEFTDEITKVAVVPLTTLVVTVVPTGNGVRSACRTLTSVTPAFTVYVMDAVFPE
jgi:hypothetical protein